MLRLSIKKELVKVKRKRIYVKRRLPSVDHLAVIVLFFSTRVIMMKVKHD